MISTFILGNIMVATGLTGLVVKDVVYPLVRYKKEKKIYDTQHFRAKDETLDGQYTRFFENIGLINRKNGDWIKVVGGVDKHEFYSKVSFYLSDTLSILSFQKQCENIRQKLKVKNLDIYEDNGKMVFRSRAEELPTIPYQYNKTPKNLIPLGDDLDKKTVYWNLNKDPHAIVVGMSGSGKSNLINLIIDHILHNYKDCKLFLADYKGGMELSTYENIDNVVAYSESLKDANSFIASIEEEYDNRIEILKKHKYRDYSKFVNDKPNTSLKRCFIIIDEFSMLLRLDSKNSDFNAIDTLIDLSKRIRATGMHMILACQRPTVASIPSELKANISCIIGMRTRDTHNSELIIEKGGLEKLNKGECIGIIDNKEIFFKSYYVNDNTISETVKEFSKKCTSVKQTDTQCIPQKLLK